MTKQYLNPKNFTHIMGAYSHGLKIDIGDSEMIFVTGQIAMDKDGNAVAPNDIVKQTEFVFENIQAILKEGNASIDDVVKAVIYVTDISKFKEISAVRNKYFANAKPVSTLVEINKTVKEGCDIEIEVMAIKKKH
ncbi:MAG: RidA family protein [Patescibacteria group bacterium]|nr:RidA family protein [Patescibacteria group bacterium]MDD5164007.1 RidA family protein [Patescibacteria group bacterium]MDD5534909.1 RidA family protein [Patescibacteria group bacterium]